VQCALQDVSGVMRKVHCTFTTSPAGQKALSGHMPGVKHAQPIAEMHYLRIEWITVLATSALVNCSISPEKVENHHNRTFPEVCSAASRSMTCVGEAKIWHGASL